MLIKRLIRRLVPIILSAIIIIVLFIYWDTRLEIVTQLYYQNAFERHKQALTRGSEQIDIYLQQSLTIIEEFATTFPTEPSDASLTLDITALNDAIAQLMLSFPEMAYVRIFDGEFSQLLFSNNLDDIVSSTSVSVQLKAIDQLIASDVNFLRLIESKIDDPTFNKVLFNNIDNTIAYSIRIPSDTPSAERVFVAYGTLSEIEHILHQERLIDPQEMSVVFGNGILLNALFSINYDQINANELTHSVRFIFDNQFEFVNLQLSSMFATYYYFVPTERLHFSDELRIIVYIVVTLTVLLFSILIIHIPQDNKAIVRERIRLFRLRLLRIAQKRQLLNSQQLNSFIFSEKKRIYRKVTSGLPEDATIERHFDQQWNELLTTLRVIGVIPAPSTSHISSNSEMLRSPAHTKNTLTDTHSTKDLESLLVERDVAGNDSIEEIEDVVSAESTNTHQQESRDSSDDQDLDSVLALEGAEMSGLRADLKDPIDLPDDVIELMPDADEQAEEQVAYKDSLSNTRAEEQKTGVVLKQDIVTSHSIRLPDIERDVSTAVRDSLFLHAQHLKYNAIITSPSGMHVINSRLSTSAHLDRELQEIIDSIS